MQLTKNAQTLGISQQMLDKSLVSADSGAPIAALMRRAMAGEAITVGLIGGSCTVGAAASCKERSYAGLLKAWWENTFPSAAITFVNAGFSGTSSLLGVHRVEETLLSKRPDFVLVEFGVNDIVSPLQAEAYAGLMHKIVTAPSAPAVMALSLMNSGGINAQEIQQPVCAYYRVPMVSYRDAIWPQVRTDSQPDGRYTWEEICADWVHPTDKGHAIIAELLLAYLNEVYEAAATYPAPDTSLPVPMRPDVYEKAAWHHCENTSPVSLGSFSVFTEECCCWKNEGEDPLVLQVNAKRVILLICTPYSDDLKMTAQIDGVERPLPDYILRGGIYTSFLLLDEADAAAHTIKVIPNGDTVWCGGLLVS